MFNSIVQSQIINMVVPMIATTLQSENIQKIILEKLKERELQNILITANTLRTLIDGYIANNPDKIPSQYLLIYQIIANQIENVCKQSIK